MAAFIFDFNRTLFDPEQNRIEEDAFPLLELIRAKRYKLALLSVGGEEREEQIQPIASFFDAIVIVPDKSERCFLEIAQQLAVKPSTIIVVGDRIEREIVLGKKCGMKTIWLQRGQFSTERPKNEQEQPDYTFTCLSDITMFLKNMNLGGI